MLPWLLPFASTLLGALERGWQGAGAGLVVGLVARWLVVHSDGNFFGRPRPVAGVGFVGMQDAFQARPESKASANARRQQLLTWSVLAGIVALWWLWPPRMLPADITLMRLTNGASTSATDPCSGRSRCVLLYLAPWCPACNQVVANVAEIRGFWQARGRPGLKVVVGQDKHDKLAAMAQRIGEPVFLDDTGELARWLKLNAYPSWFVLDERQRVLKAGGSALSWTLSEINAHQGR